MLELKEEYFKYVHKDLHEDVKHFVENNSEEDFHPHVIKWWKDEEKDDDEDVHQMKRVFKKIKEEDKEDREDDDED